jgi:hypothetical protein
MPARLSRMALNSARASMVAAALAWLAFSSPIAGAVTLVSPHAHAALNPVFSPVIVALRSRTSVPLWLPTYLPEHDRPIFASVKSVTPKSFWIALELDRKCGGAFACAYGGYEAVVAGTTPLSGVPIRLAGNRTGYFTEATCGGAGCSDAILAWDYHGYRYSAEMKAGPKHDLIAEANSISLY